MTIYNIITCQFAAAAIAYLLNLLIGASDFVLHPVRLMGNVTDLFERAVRAVFPKNKGGEIFGGFVMALLVIAVCGGIPFAILFFAYRYNMLLGVCVEAVIGYFMLGTKPIARAGKDIYNALMSDDTEDARYELSMVDSRDTERMDDKGIARAAVETVAENTNDAVVAPLLYMAIGGAVLGCVYRAINTMDKMVGYEDAEYINFGKFATKLDSVVNYIPSRIAARLMIISSSMSGFDARHAAYIHKRDSRKRPNSAQTISVVAGALRIMLGGDAYYFGKLYQKPTIGDDLKDVSYYNILQTAKIMYLASFLAAIIFLALKFGSNYVIQYADDFIRLIISHI